MAALSGIRVVELDKNCGVVDGPVRAAAGRHQGVVHSGKSADILRDAL